MNGSMLRNENGVANHDFTIDVITTQGHCNFKFSYCLRLAAVLYQALTDSGADEPSRRTPRPAFSSRRLPRLSATQQRPTLSQIAMHLIDPALSSHSQIRWSSSDSHSTSDPQRGSDKNEQSGNETNDSSFASAFGFQSLSGLFHQPARPQRYSRPSDSHAESETPSIDPSFPSKTEDRIEKKDNRMGEGFFKSVSPSKERADQTVGPSLTTSESSQGGLQTATDGSIRADPSSGAKKREPKVYRLQSQRKRTPLVRHIARDPATRKHVSLPGHPQQEKTINPFLRRSKERATNVKSRPQREVKAPWGMADDYIGMLESTSGMAAANDQGRSEAVDSTQSVQVGIDTATQKGDRLTHVTPSGQAHMVDVGAKPATRRVAIAFAAVVFKNPDPFRLIFENANKKGDVLAVARVAGIMAAKRTSELIPLCHPVTISKSEVDVELIAPGVNNTLWSSNKHGVVAIRTLVECNGATGVEMEALTAASTAALTVYDMCKAVDRSMRINNACLLYKCGGKSGLYAVARWYERLDEEFLLERGLEVPTEERGKEVGSGSG